MYLHVCVFMYGCVWMCVLYVCVCVFTCVYANLLICVLCLSYSLCVCLGVRLRCYLVFICVCLGGLVAVLSFKVYLCVFLRWWWRTQTSPPPRLAASSHFWHGSWPSLTTPSLSIGSYLTRYITNSNSFNTMYIFALVLTIRSYQWANVNVEWIIMPQTWHK